MFLFISVRCKLVYQHFNCTFKVHPIMLTATSLEVILSRTTKRPSTVCLGCFFSPAQRPLSFILTSLCVYMKDLFVGCVRAGGKHRRPSVWSHKVPIFQSCDSDFLSRCQTATWRLVDTGSCQHPSSSPTYNTHSHKTMQSWEVSWLAFVQPEKVYIAI